MFLYDKYRLRKVVDLHRFPNMLALFTLRLMLANIRRRISADSLTDLNPSIPRDAALSNVTRLRICCMSLASCSESGTESTEKSASVHHCVRCASAPGSTLALWSDVGAMPAASTGQLQRDGACYGRVQCWGRGYGHLERYTDACGVLERV